MFTAILVSHGSGAMFILAFVDFSISITQLDCNIALQFILEPHSLHGIIQNESHFCLQSNYTGQAHKIEDTIYSLTLDVFMHLSLSTPDSQSYISKQD
jgi:hypothetical protein